MRRCGQVELPPAAAAAQGADLAAEPDGVHHNTMDDCPSVALIRAAVPCAPMPETPEAQLIHARGLTKRFGAFTAVDAVDFDVAPAEAFGFLGPNGAGKTSTMRMIGGGSPGSGGTLRVVGAAPRT